MANLNVTRTSAGHQWTLVDTANPEESTLAVFMDRTNIGKDDTPKQGSKYGDWPKKWPELLQGRNDFSDWTYAEKRNDAGPGDTITFFWVRPRTQVERDTPFRTKWETDLRPWPSILRWLRFDLDNQQNQISLMAYLDERSTIYIPRYFVTKGWIPGGNKTTRIKTEYFLSDVEYPQQDHQGLEPGDISWQFSDIEGGLPQCLHDDVVIPSRQVVGMIATDGVTNASETQTGLPNKQFIPATNPTEWIDYVVSDTQEFINGQWLRTLVTFEAPPIPDIAIEPG